MIIFFFEVEVAVKKESKYLCSAALTSRQALWQHQRKQRRENKLKSSPQKTMPEPENGHHSGPQLGQIESMAKFSEAMASTGKELKGGGEETEMSLAESFLLGKFLCISSSVSDPDPCGSVLKWLPRIRIRTGNTDPDPYPGQSKWRPKWVKIQKFQAGKSIDLLLEPGSLYARSF